MDLGAAGGDTSTHGMTVAARLDEVVEIVDALGTVFVRFSAGPEADAHSGSRDGESGAVLPGLSVNPLRPEPWWDRPPREWVARQLAQYVHLAADDHRYAWLLRGREVGRGPDSEPLLTDVVPVAVVSNRALQEAVEAYRTAFAPGQVPDGP
ncbi:DUF6098 family protein [Cellulomonas fimi]|uniref:DUF6098 family protein n=1 Tax=Cellulomonas fimi TaxID=1708 RepID=UPI00234DC7AF|nr:DUF6098 family protein [Cellulomonas fimi]MDC7120872.1 DUF6098 family protein [Cellulomonas fimi]